MALNVYPETSFNNVWDWKECGREQRKLTVKIFVTMMRIFVKFSMGVTLILFKV
jgi:hypothetical protein